MSEEKIPPVRELRPLLRPLFALLIHAADTIANGAPSANVEGWAESSLIEGSVRRADNLLDYLVRTDPLEAEAEPPAPPPREIALFERALPILREVAAGNVDDVREKAVELIESFDIPF